VPEPGDPAAAGDSAHRLVDTVLVASQMMVAVAARTLDDAAGDVTLPQFRVLVMLSLHGAQRPSALAADLDVEPSTATRMCDRLVRKGLVSRQHSDTDRRTVVLDLTDAGHELVRGVMHRRRLEFEQLAATVPADQHDAVIGALRVLINASGARPDRDWALWS
jgi:DNA-binding MarR family transcriptional regulator